MIFCKSRERLIRDRIDKLEKLVVCELRDYQSVKAQYTMRAIWKMYNLIMHKL